LLSTGHKKIIQGLYVAGGLRVWTFLVLTVHQKNHYLPKIGKNVEGLLLEFLPIPAVMEAGHVFEWHIF